ncbi:hypothetical protein V6N13_023166 [Hibiscus sabdariffa]
MILSNLDARSVALSLLVSRAWHGVASSDSLWSYKAAPEYWRNLDPRRYFHPDGSQTAGADDKVWGGHECCYSIVTSIVGDGKIREHYVRINRLPRLFISRNQDWSWEMSNCLYRYSSIPDVDKQDRIRLPLMLNASHMLHRHTVGEGKGFFGANWLQDNFIQFVCFFPDAKVIELG